MKDYVGENQRILDEWCAKFIEDKRKDPSYDGYNPADYFAPDGIMNKGEFYLNDDKECRRYPTNPQSSKENQMWNVAPLRILFLSKDQNAFGGDAKDVRSETFHKKDINTPDINDYQIEDSLFYKNEACLLYRILHSNIDNERSQILDFSWEDAVKLADEQIFARINCKKEIGGGSCDNWVLQKAIDEYREYLKMQIINLDADILICCGYNKQVGETHNIILNFLNTNGYDFRKVEECGEDIYYDNSKNKVAFNIYHLSYRWYDYIKTIKAYYKFLRQHPDFINTHRK